MNMNLNQKKYWLIPVMMAAVLSLTILAQSKWPLSWDVYTHINYALTYANYGITTVDPYLNAPNGKQIGYVPLFHVLFILVSRLTQTSFIDTARIIAFVSPVVITGLVMYVSYKMSDELAALVSGLLLISSFMFMRMFLPIPETIAVMFFIAGVYCFYRTTAGGNYRHLLICSIGTLVMLGLHFTTAIYYLILITTLTAAQAIILKNASPIKSYMALIAALAIFAASGFVALTAISPSHASQLFAGIFSILSDPMSLFMGQKAMGLERYVKCIGILPLACAILGLHYSFKDKEMLFASAWCLAAFVFSNLHWFGIPVYTFRMLVYLIIPAVVVGGYGVCRICEKLDNKNKPYAAILILALVAMSAACGYTAINDDSVKNTYAATEISTYKIAPPTQEAEEVINWFGKEDTRNKSILTNNLFFGTIISSVDEVPMHYKFDAYTNKSSSKSSLKTLENEKIGYIVYDKSLVAGNQSDYDALEVEYANGSYYPTYYFTKEITGENFNQIQLPNTKKVFENNRFIICEVQN